MADQIIGGVRYKDMGDGTFALEATLVNPVSGPSAVIRTTAGYAAPGQSIKTYTGKVATSASTTTTVTLETVTAGKTFFITDLYAGFDNNAQIDTRLQAAGVDIFRVVVKGDTAPCQMAGMESQPSATAGALVTILLPVIAGAPNFYFYVGGVEQ